MQLTKKLENESIYRIEHISKNLNSLENNEESMSGKWKQTKLSKYS